MKIDEIDNLEVIVLMDNLSDPFSETHAQMKLNEAQYRSQMLRSKTCSGSDYCRACLGLSFLIRVTKGSERFSLLFDTGPDEGLAVDNAKRLGIDLREIDAIALSHGHFDHISGIHSFLREIHKPKLAVHVHNRTFAPRAWRKDNGDIVYSSTVREEDIKELGGDIIKNTTPKSLFLDRIVLSGEVPRLSSYETGFDGEMCQIDGKWIDAPLIEDEQILITRLKNKGLCVFTGCGHTGVVNALRYAQDLTGDPIHVIMGGFHLAGPTFEKRISRTIDDLNELSPDFLITGHCTGFTAQSALTSHFHDRHIPYGVGACFRFSATL